MVDTFGNLNLNNIVAEDIMSDHVAVIKKSMLIGQVVHLMLREKISGYPVVDDNGKLEGIVTLTDFFLLLDNMVKEISDDNLESRKITLHQKIIEVKDRPIEEIMSKNVVCITPDTCLGEIIENVAYKHIHSFPVIKDGKLVGIVGRRDVLNAAFVYG